MRSRSDKQPEANSGAYRCYRV